MKRWLLGYALFVGVSIQAQELSESADSTNALPPILSLAAGEEPELQEPKSLADYRADEEIRLIVTLNDPSGFAFAKVKQATRGQFKSADGGSSAETARKLDNHIQGLHSKQQGFVQALKRQQLIIREGPRFQRLLNGVTLTALAKDFAAIAALPEVKHVSIDHRGSGTLNQSTAQIGAPTLWARQDAQTRPITGQGVKVAIIDSGIDYTHPDLGAGCFGQGCKVVGGYDFVNDDDDPMDDNGHGTLVAGVVAANGTLKGVAPDAELLAYKVLDASGRGWSSHLIAALEKAVDPDGDPLTADAPDIINLSLRFYISGVNNSISQAVKQTIDAGIIVVVAAGNEGPNYGSVLTPANVAEAITVGAVDGGGSVASFSSRGLVGGRVAPDYPVAKPDLMAPGVFIQTTYLGGAYAYASGTSLSAPHVAGAAALLRQLHPDLEVEDIKALLVNNAAQMGQDPFINGNGLVDLVVAADAEFLIKPVSVNWNHLELGSAAERQVNVTLKNISNQTLEVNISDQGLLLPHGSLSPTQIMLEPAQEKSHSFSLDLNPATIPYKDNLEMPYYSYLAFASAAESKVMPYVFRRAEILELRETSVKEHYTYSAYAFDENRVAFTAAREFDGDDSTIRFALGNQTVNLLFRNEQTNRFYGKDAVPSTQSSAILFDAAVPGNKVMVEKDLGRRQLDIMERHFTIRHEDNPDFEMFFGMGGELPEAILGPLTLINIHDGYQFDFFAIAEEAGQHERNRKLYFFPFRARGVYADVNLVYDPATFRETRMLVNEPKWFAEGVRELTIPARYYPEGVAWIGSGSHEYTEPFTITTYGKVRDTDPPDIHLRLSYRTQASEITNLGHTNEWGFTENALQKYRHGEVGEGMMQKVLERDLEQGPIFLGQGPRFWVMGVKDEGLYYRLSPTLNGFVGLTSVMDSWGNIFAGSLPYEVSCADDGSIRASGDLNAHFGAVLHLQSSCSERVLEFSYYNHLLGLDHTSTARLEMTSLYGSRSPRLTMLELLNGDRVWPYIDGPFGKINVRAEDEDGEVTFVGIELKLDQGDWESLEVAVQHDNYQASLPEIDAHAIASVRITLEDDEGNRLINTINGAFVIGNTASEVVDLDGDSVVDKYDPQPLNPLRAGEPLMIEVSNRLAASRQVNRGTQSVVVHRFRMQVGEEPTELSSIKLQASGDGDDVVDIKAINLYLDQNADGIVDSGDLLLGTTTYAEDDGELVLNLSTPYRLAYGINDFLVSYDF